MNFYREKKSVVFLIRWYILLFKKVRDDDREEGDNSQLRPELKKHRYVIDKGQGIVENIYIQKGKQFQRDLPLCQRWKNNNTLQKRLLWLDQKPMRAFLFLHFLTLNSLFYLL